MDPHVFLTIEGLVSMYSNLLPENRKIPGLGTSDFWALFCLSASYRPVTYISIPSLKVKMVVVLELLAPCFTSLMVS